MSAPPSTSAPTSAFGSPDENLDHPRDRFTFRKLSSPAEDSNWDTWSFAFKMMVAGLGLSFIISNQHKPGYSREKPQPHDSLAMDHLRLASYLTARVHEDNYSIIASHSNNAYDMYNVLRDHHQNRSAGGRYMYMRQMMLASTADGIDEVLKHVLALDGLRTRLNSISMDGKITVDDFFVAAVISTIPQTWEVAIRHLEANAVISVPDVKNAIKAEATKRRNQEPSSTHTLTVASVASAEKPTTSSNKQKWNDGGASSTSGYKGSHPLCDSCGRHHPGKFHKSKTVEKSEIDQLKYEINKLKKKTRRANKAARAKDSSSSDSDVSTDDDK